MPLTVIAQTVKSLLDDTSPGALPTIDTIVLDATQREHHQFHALPIDHPVEPDAGGSVSDHIYLEPEVVTLDCVVTNTPINDPPSHANGAVAVPRIITPFSSLIDNPGEVISNRLGAGDPTLGLTGQVGLPPTVGLAKGFVPEFDRTRAVFEELVAIREEKRFITIVTALRVYNSMQLIGIDVPHEREGSLFFTVTARRVDVTETEEVPVTATSITTKAANLGKKAATPADEQSSTRARSLAKRLLD